MNQVKQSKTWQLARHLAVFSLILVCLQTPLVVLGWSKLPQFSLVFKSIADICLLVSAGLILFNIWSNDFDGGFKADKLVVLLASFVVLNLIAGFLKWENFSSFAAGMLINLRFIIAFLINYCIAWFDGSWSRKLVKVFLNIGLVVLGFAILQLTILPKDFLTNFGYSKQTIAPYTMIDENLGYSRINSTLRGPNPLGALAMIILSLAFSYHLYTKDRHQSLKTVLLMTAALPVLYFSYSRSAWLASVIAILLVAGFGYKFAKTKVIRILIATLILLITFLGIVILIDDNHSLQDEFEHIILHENEASLNAKSNDEHNSSIAQAINSVLSWPLGHGVGSAGSASLFRNQPVIVENQYLLVAYETGIIGMSLFIASLVIILLNLNINRDQWLALGLFSSGIGLLIIGLVLPVFVDSAVAVVWWSLSGAIIGKNRYNTINGTTKTV